MRIERSVIKAQAKEAMRQARTSTVVVTLVYWLISFVLAMLVMRVSGQWDMIRYMLEDIFLYGDLSSYIYYYFRPSFIGTILQIALELMALVLSAGFVLYALRVSRHQQAGIATLFDTFGFFFRVLGQQILIGIFVFLWSLLFVIPGIIAAYRYSLALYILFDNPDMGILDTISRSKALMRGRKGELFVLDLSFLGWALLCIIPFVGLWVTPYISVTRANYYNAILDLEAEGANGPYTGPHNGPYGGQGPDDHNPW